MAIILRAVLIIILAPYLLGAPSGLVPEKSPSPLEWESQEAVLTLPEGQNTAEAWFSFTNISGLPVHILRIDSHCDCVVTTIERKQYYPGESGVILARISLGEDEQELEKRMYVSLKKGDGTHMTAVLRISASREN